MGKINCVPRRSDVFAYETHYTEGGHDTRRGSTLDARPRGRRDRETGVVTVNNACSMVDGQWFSHHHFSAHISSFQISRCILGIPMTPLDRRELDGLLDLVFP